MMEEMKREKKDSRIGHCMRENLSGLRATDEACAQIRGRVYGKETARNGVHSRRGQLRLAVAFALALTLLAATATAAMTAWREYAMRAQQTEKAVGAFASWALEDKKETVAQLIEAGLLDGDERAAQLMDGKLTQEEGHALADAIVAEMLGRDADNFGVLELTERVFGGPFDAWSYQDKAWWQSVTDAAGTSGDYYRYTLPREGELTYDEALALAKETATQAFGLDAQTLDGLDVACDFIDFAFDEEMRVWRFTFGGAAYSGESGCLVWIHAGTHEIRRVENW